eukprot:460132-Amphidinium_carterae.1
MKDAAMSASLCSDLGTNATDVLMSISTPQSCAYQAGHQQALKASTPSLAIPQQHRKFFANPACDLKPMRKCLP